MFKGLCKYLDEISPTFRSSWNKTNKLARKQNYFIKHFVFIAATMVTKWLQVNRFSNYIKVFQHFSGNSSLPLEEN